MLGTAAVLAVGAQTTAASSGSAETNGVRRYGHGPYGTSVFPAAVPDISDGPSLSLEHVVWTTETSDTPFDVTATIGNDGETTAEGDVTVAVVDDDDVMAFRETKSLEIDANASETVTFEDILDGLPEGEYVFSVSVADDPGEFEATVKVTDRGYDTDEDGWGSELSRYSIGNDGEVDSNGLSEAFTDWQGGQLSSDDLRRVFHAWQASEAI
ncbi:CARDB domain-containing protein [Natrialba sp. INN-245]|uniref:CARDB domain-containing protein n=1 Tax=Natrialba sp. INN-245 TaxID=2690967 RepID=UPI0013132583|nr:CARDB domain-containing protein [Natrialba sp. INN-245]MWV40859.1 hypothetical protein [Natrialba sp. INN-245]